MNMKYGWLILLIFGTLPLQAGANGSLRQAGKLYEQEKYGQALSTYETVLQSNPSNAKAAFGAGASAYHLKEYTQAATAFESASHEKGKLGQDALFNLGNTYYRAGKKDEATAAYKQAILQDLKDKEAIHNLQLLLQQEKQQNKNDQNNQNQDQQSQNNDSQDQQNNQGQAPQERQNEPNKQPQTPQDSQNQLDKQAADRVMQLARDNEYKRPTQPGQMGEDESVEKDW